jgi:hypothetical protein
MLGEAANAPWRSAVPLLGDVRPTVNAIREEANSFRLLTLGSPLLAEAQFSRLLDGNRAAISPLLVVGRVIARSGVAS